MEMTALRRPGTLRATVVDDLIGAPVADAAVVVTVGTTSGTGTTNGGGVATVANLAPGSGSVEVSLETFQTQTASTTIRSNETTPLDVELRAQHAGCRRCLYDQRHRHADRQWQGTHHRAAGRRRRPASPMRSTRSRQVISACLVACQRIPTPNPGSAECLRFPEDPAVDGPYTVDNAAAAAFGLVPGEAAADYAAVLMLDQSRAASSVPIRRKPGDFSAKAFVQTVDAASGDAVLLTSIRRCGQRFETADVASVVRRRVHDGRSLILRCARFAWLPDRRPHAALSRALPGADRPEE